MQPIQIEQLTVTEKIQFMESLWDGLYTQSENIVSLAWHDQVLQEREATLQNQTDGFVDWQAAKQTIRKQVL